MAYNPIQGKTIRMAYAYFFPIDNQLRDVFIIIHCLSVSSSAWCFLLIIHCLSVSAWTHILGPRSVLVRDVCFF